MRGLLRAEWVKLTTTRTTIWLLVALLALMLLSTLLPLLASPQGTQPLPGDPGLQRIVLYSGSRAATFALILGIIGAAGEYRHSTITPTLLVSPNRGRVLSAKAVLYAVAGIVLAAGSFAVAAIVLVAVAGPADVTLGGGEVTRLVLGGLAFSALSGGLGIGLGFLVRSQVGALSLALVVLLVAEPIVQVFLPDVGRWLLGFAGQALAGASMIAVPINAPDAPARGLSYLSQTTGGLVVLGYTVLVLGLGYWRLRKQDVA